MYIFNAIHQHFIWLGYGGFWKFYLENLYICLFWLSHVTPVAIIVWGVADVVYADKIKKFVKKSYRYFRRWKKPGPESDYEKYLRVYRQNKKLKAEITEYKNKEVACYEDRV